MQRFKGNRLVRAALLVVAVLDKAQERASKIAKRVTKFNRSGALDEIAALFEAIQPTADEMKPLNKFVAPGLHVRPVFCYHDPDLPKLKRSKHKLNYDGLADNEQMLMILEEWAISHDQDALQVVENTFDGDDIRAKRVWPTSVNFLAYAKQLGDFLANVTFHVDYLFIAEDYSDMAETAHNVDLWITLDPTKRNVVDVVMDNWIHSILATATSS